MPLASANPRATLKTSAMMQSAAPSHSSASSAPYSSLTRGVLQSSSSTVLNTNNNSSRDDLRAGHASTAPAKPWQKSDSSSTVTEPAASRAAAAPRSVVAAVAAVAPAVSRLSYGAMARRQQPCVLPPPPLATSATHAWEPIPPVKSEPVLRFSPPSVPATPSVLSTEEELAASLQRLYPSLFGGDGFHAREHAQAAVASRSVRLATTRSPTSLHAPTSALVSGAQDTPSTLLPVSRASHQVANALSVGSSDVASAAPAVCARATQPSPAAIRAPALSAIPSIIHKASKVDSLKDRPMQPLAPSIASAANITSLTAAADPSTSSSPVHSSRPSLTGSLLAKFQQLVARNDDGLAPLSGERPNSSSEIDLLYDGHIDSARGTETPLSADEHDGGLCLLPQLLPLPDQAVLISPNHRQQRHCDMDDPTTSDSESPCGSPSSPSSNCADTPQTRMAAVDVTISSEDAVGSGCAVVQNVSVVGTDEVLLQQQLSPSPQEETQPPSASSSSPPSSDLMVLTDSAGPSSTTTTTVVAAKTFEPDAHNPSFVVQPSPATAEPSSSSGADESWSAPAHASGEDALPISSHVAATATKDDDGSPRGEATMTSITSLQHENALDKALFERILSQAKDDLALAQRERAETLARLEGEVVRADQAAQRAREEARKSIRRLRAHKDTQRASKAAMAVAREALERAQQEASTAAAAAQCAQQELCDELSAVRAVLSDMAAELEFDNFTRTPSPSSSSISVVAAAKQLLDQVRTRLRDSDAQRCSALQQVQELQQSLERAIAQQQAASAELAAAHEKTLEVERCRHAAELSRAAEVYATNIAGEDERRKKLEVERDCLARELELASLQASNTAAQAQAREKKQLQMQQQLFEQQLDDSATKARQQTKEAMALALREQLEQFDAQRAHWQLRLDTALQQQKQQLQAAFADREHALIKEHQQALHAQARSYPPHSSSALTPHTAAGAQQMAATAPVVVRPVSHAADVVSSPGAAVLLLLSPRSTARREADEAAQLAARAQRLCAQAAFQRQRHVVQAQAQAQSAQQLKGFSFTRVATTAAFTTRAGI